MRSHNVTILTLWNTASMEIISQSNNGREIEIMTQTFGSKQARRSDAPLN